VAGIAAGPSFHRRLPETPRAQIKTQDQAPHPRHIREMKTMSIAEASNLGFFPSPPLSMRLIIAAACVALADWLF
jgi:hypothetical protein